MFQTTAGISALYFGAGQTAKKPRIALIGVPFNSAGTSHGVASAPQALRAAGLVRQLQEVSPLRDYGDLKFLPGTPKRDPVTKIIAPESAGSMITAVEDAVEDALKHKSFPLVVGGDCPVLLGALRAAKKRDGAVGLLFVDGHEDAYAPGESPTGELADMELGFALGRNLQSVPASIATSPPLVASSSVVVLGARDAEQIQKDGSHSLKGELDIQSPDELRAGGLTKIANAGIDRILSDTKKFWLHVDLDVLSSEALPAVDYPQAGGLSWEELAEICRVAIERESVIGLDVTIYNPDLDREAKYAGRIVEFIADVARHIGVKERRG